MLLCIELLTFPFLLLTCFYSSASGCLSARALDAKAGPSDLWYNVELLLRKTWDCSEISRAETLQTSLELCMCCNVLLQEQLSVSKRDTRGSFSFSSLWGIGASLLHQVASRLISFYGECASVKCHFKYSCIAAWPMEGTGLNISFHERHKQVLLIMGIFLIPLSYLQT